MSFWPNKIEIKEVLINSLWSLIAWVIWGLIMILIVFFLSWFINIPAWFSNEAWVKTTTMFPIILSLVALVWTSITMFLTYKLLTLTSPDRYKKNIIVLWQIAFFTIFIYFFITPIYIIEWLKTYENIIFIFLVHTLVLAFWTSIIIEVLNNYRYVLLGLYGSFIWLFVSIIFTFFIFNSFSAWFAKLISLVVLLPVINFLMTFFKQLFELIYFYYFKYTNQDQLWDIFYRIELEEKEQEREEEEKNSI